MFTRILVGTDGSPESGGALRLVSRLADDAATVLVTSVVGRLRRLAVEADCDLIVLGDHHRREVGRATLDGTAAATLRAAPCAVAIATAGPVGRLRAVGVGFDGSAAARRAVAVAAGLAEQRGARLTVLSVVDPRNAYAATDRGGGYGEGRRVARGALAVAVSDVHGVTDVHRQLHEGDPVHEVLALGRDVDLLVLGARVGGTTRRMELGGVGTAVVRRASCPVLVVPETLAGRATTATLRAA